MLTSKSISGALIILSPCVILHSLAMDIFVPCVPLMQGALNASFAKVQWVLSIFMLATGAGQIFVGPLADKFGRRIIMLLSILLFLSASIACALAQNINFLILARFIQGLGACGTMVATWAIVRDLFNDDDRPKMYSYLNAALALAPLLAPLLGGYLYAWYNTWRATFYFLAGFSAVTIVIVYFKLNETKPLQTQSYNYFKILNNLQFWTFTMCAVTALTQLFTFFSMSPILLIEHLGVNPIHYGYFFGLNALVYMICSVISPQLKMSYGLNHTVLLGSTIIFCGALLMLFWHHLYGLSKVGLLLPNIITTSGVGIIFGACTAGALAPFKEMAGTASAAYGFVLYCGSGLIGAFAMQFKVESTLNLAVTMVTLGAMNIALMLLSSRKA